MKGRRDRLTLVTIVDVTLRLDGRALHLVHRASDCDFCRNRRAHTTLDARPFVRAEVERAQLHRPGGISKRRRNVAWPVPASNGNRMDVSLNDHLSEAGVSKWIAETACTEAPVPRAGV